MIDWNKIKEAIIIALKDHGIDWILEERQLVPFDEDFERLVEEIMLALKGVII